MQLDIFAEHGGSFGRTYQEPSAATGAEILLSWLAQWQDAGSMSPQMAGARKAWRWVTPGLSSGACLTRNGSEWRSGAVACSLSSTLETGPVDHRFYLSPKACAGILRRAERRGKALPTMLHHALVQVAGASSEPEKPADKIQSLPSRRASRQVDYNVLAKAADKIR